MDFIAFSVIFLKNLHLFIYFWLCWVFVAMRRLSLAAASRGYSSLQCAGFSLRWLLFVVEHGLQVHGLQYLWLVGSRAQAQQLWRMGFSICGLRALERRLSSCGAWAQLLRGMWDLPGPGLEPVSLALADEFLTTAPPGKFPV